jgi:hypothetical protein
MRVIFDRSAFHGERFEALARSPLQQIVRGDRIRVFHTPIFIEETISTFGSAGPSGDWRRHLAFALQICNGGVFDEKMDIWRREIVEGRGPLARYLMSERLRKHGSKVHLLQRLSDAVRTGDLGREWDDTQSMREESHQKKKNQKALARDIRADISTAIREGRITAPIRAASFKHFRDSEFIRTGRHLMRLVDARRQGLLADQWERRPDHCPFYSAFVEGVLYSVHHAAVEHNKPIDDNAQGDYEQLAYLTWADMIVSDDTRFLRDAFEVIWKPRGKRLETSESFAALVARLA